MLSRRSLRGRHHSGRWRAGVVVLVGMATTVGVTVEATSAAAAGTISQTAPIAGSVTVGASSTFTDQLAVSGNVGAATYNETTGGSHLSVSTSGQVTTTGLLLPGPYTATGTTSDAFGDGGTFTYTLTVGTITQSAPTAGSSTVNGSSSFAAELSVSGANGTVTYGKTGGSASLEVSPNGAITTTGTLPAASYTATGTTSDQNGDTGTFTYTLTVGTITQSAPMAGSSTVTGSSSFTDHLAVTGNSGAVTYAETGGSASLTVSPSGKVATIGALAPGPYTATGTTSDANGDSGTFTYTLTVGTITQGAPTTGSSTVAASSTFSAQLSVSGANGTVTYARTAGSTSLGVSASGGITTTGTLAAGTYAVSGTTTDPNGDSGTFAFALTVAITQIAPTAGSAPVSGSSAFVDQLAVTGNTGAVAFTKTGGTPFMTVSASGAVTTTGTLAAGHYTVTGTTADTNGGSGSFTYTLTVTAGTISQSTPTAGSATVSGSLAFVDQLAVSGTYGTVTFAKTGGGSHLTVSASGQVGTNGTLAVGVYNATGSTSDADGDHGSFTYTLTVTAGTISQVAPTAGSVTVAASSSFADQLAVTGTSGSVAYTESTGSAHLTVSTSGQVTTTGLLLPGPYTATGTTSDSFGDSGVFTYTLTVGTITQSAPTAGSSTVTGSATFTDHLAVAGNNGAVTFAKTGGSASLDVSASGTLATTGMLAAGPYSATGTTIDPNGDSGTFTYTLTVTAATITQALPTSGTTAVPRSPAFTAQLAVTGSHGTVNFTKAAGSPRLLVSTHGTVTVSGTLAAGAYGASGTTSDAFGDRGTFTYTLHVGAASIRQTGSVVSSSTVAGSGAFRRRLTVSGNKGPVTFTRMGGSARLRISTAGVVTTTGTLPTGTYTIIGTTKDSYGDRGTFRVTLAVRR